MEKSCFVLRPLDQVVDGEDESAIPSNPFKVVLPKKSENIVRCASWLIAQLPPFTLASVEEYLKPSLVR